MRLGKGIEIIDGLPLLYIEKLSAIACSDLHLGYEGVKADRGTFLPKVNLNGIKEAVAEAIDKTGAERIIIDGDIKNEFSEVHREEFNEFRDLAIFLRNELRISRITLIKGNHDNFIERLKVPLGLEIHRQEAILSGILFFHGEELPNAGTGDLLVMGHLHPAITVYSDLGVREKLKCFLYGKTNDGRKIIVLPAMNYFAEGVGVNAERVDGMAPIFKKMLDVDSMRALCIGEGETLDFGRIGDLRNAAVR
jgi:putative SbcD/Mre11-related phosphoesterase